MTTAIVMAANVTLKTIEILDAVKKFPKQVVGAGGTSKF